ncbi:Cullin-2 [Thecamonas trahens ATCC 50062]|uniref:Cullin-5 n=1 Tax=Thecamonas trahens ATCC 50062 TaxID=461836 RepID=A0A0L0DCJ7_THETB|nr:Cullin-2 [Thecamonas trahens ATCC 50062]KNC49033.1 Cullin-2 [Thecamonas trahens ATCC 50062]|eukprot:XP_013758443.1 Cullin-2 [Thecamonas trahens ATCC 50062]
MWRDKVLAPLKDRLVYAILEQVRKERDGEAIERELVVKPIESMVKLGLERNKPLAVYSETIELPYIAALHEYYAAETTNFLAQNAVPDYYSHAETRMAEESARAVLFLDTSSEPRVTAALTDIFVTAHLPALQGEVIPLVAAMVADSSSESHAAKALARGYALLARVPGAFDSVQDALGAFVVERGLAALDKLGDEPASNPRKYVEALLEHYAAFRTVVDTAFAGSGQFSLVLDKAMREIVNAKPKTNAGSSGGASSLPPAAELLAKYCDMVLRKSSKSQLEDAELSKVLDSVMEVFQYLEDKDVFQKFYSQMLAKRLIQSLSVSDDAESAMISRLKKAAGYEYTSKLQKMFQDMTLSDELNASFATAVEKTGMDIGGVAFSFKVLTKGSWPLSSPSTPFVQPPELDKLIKRFEAFYKNQHSGRELFWLPELTKGELRTAYLAKNHDLIVTNYQMAILCLFNRGTVFSVAEIGKLVGLESKVLMRNVASLVKVKLLSLVADAGDTAVSQAEPKAEAKAKTEAKTEAETDDAAASSSAKPSKGKKGKGKKRAPIKLNSSTKLEVNLNFSNKRIRVKVLSSLIRDSTEERAATVRGVSEERMFFLQAAVVRLMKARKKMAHSVLVGEVCEIAAARFKPRVALIKKAIEQLIDKGYLARVQGEKGMYEYLA